MSSDDSLSKEQLLEEARELRAVFDLSPIPMLIVDSSGLIRQVNSAAAALGGGEQAMLNKRGGDALRCFQHLNSSEGCGLSPECQTCTLRRTVMETMTTGKPQKGVLADMKLLTLSGTWDDRKLILSTTPLRASHSPQFLVCLEDITEKFHAQAVLLASEQLARSTLNSLSAHIAIVNDQGIIKAVNQAWRDFARANGLSFQDVCEGANYFAACEEAIKNHAENAAEFLQGLRDVLAGQRLDFAIEYPCHSPNEQRWFIARVTPFSCETGPCAVVAHENITARKLSEEALRLSEEKYASAFRLCPDSITITRLHDGVFLEVSDGFTTVFGYSRQEVLGLSPLAHGLDIWVHPEERAKMVQLLNTYGEARNMETSFRTKDGRIIASLYSSRLINIAGEACLLAFVRDITERKRAEEALRLSEEKYASAFRLCPDAITISRLHDGVFLEVSDGFCKTFGFARHEVIGKSSLPHGFNIWVHSDERTKMLQTLQTHGEIIDMESAFRAKDGHLANSLFSARIINIAGEQCILTFTRDITERIEAQTLAAQNQARAAHLARLNSMGQLSAGLAHELNQPLAAIVNFVHYCQSLLATGKPGSVSLPDALNAIDREAKRAGDIIWRLRSFIRKQEPQRTPTNANDLVHDCLTLLGSTLKQNRIQTHLLLHPTLPPAMLDAVQIEQVLVNLVQNAIDAMTPLPFEQRLLTIESLSSLDCNSITIRVIDQGPGIPPDKFDHIFEEFFTSKPDGLGLGLAISKSIIESHSGHLQARPNPTRGMTFEFTLPTREH